MVDNKTKTENNEKTFKKEQKPKTKKRNIPRAYKHSTHINLYIIIYILLLLPTSLSRVIVVTVAVVIVDYLYYKLLLMQLILMLAV